MGYLSRLAELNHCINPLEHRQVSLSKYSRSIAMAESYGNVFQSCQAGRGDLRRLTWLTAWKGQ
jgi:hypothetical protein